MSNVFKDAAIRFGDQNGEIFNVGDEVIYELHPDRKWKIIQTDEDMFGKSVYHIKTNDDVSPSRSQRGVLGRELHFDI